MEGDRNWDGRCREASEQRARDYEPSETDA